MLEPLESQIRKLRSLFWSDRDQEGQAFVALAESYRRTGDLGQALELLEEVLRYAQEQPEVASSVVKQWLREGPTRRTNGEPS